MGRDRIERTTESGARQENRASLYPSASVTQLFQPLPRGRAVLLWRFSQLLQFLLGALLDCFAAVLGVRGIGGEKVEGLLCVLPRQILLAVREIGVGQAVVRSE